MRIETPRLIIRDFVAADAADLYEILGDAETMKYSEPEYDFEKTKSFLNSFCIERRAAVASEHRASGKMIGYILFNEFEEGEYEIGWFINRGFWRQGYAYEASRAVIAHAFAELKACKIFAETIDTGKSVGLMEKLGMKLEKIHRNEAADNYGNPADMYYYCLTAEEWRDK